MKHELAGLAVLLGLGAIIGTGEYNSRTQYFSGEVQTALYTPVAGRPRVVLTILLEDRRSIEITVGNRLLWYQMPKAVCVKIPPFGNPSLADKRSCSGGDDHV